MSDRLTHFTPSENDVARFMSKVQFPVDTEFDTACWVWVGAKHGQDTGYGKIRMAGSVQNAHKVSFLMFNGDVAPGMVVAHQCNNSACVSPHHLAVETQSQNMKYCVMSGRHPSQKKGAK